MEGELGERKTVVVGNKAGDTGTEEGKGGVAEPRDGWWRIDALNYKGRWMGNRECTIGWERGYGRYQSILAFHVVEVTPYPLGQSVVAPVEARRQPTQENPSAREIHRPVQRRFDP